MANHVKSPKVKRSTSIDKKRLSFIFLGLFLFLIVYFSPPFPDAIDPSDPSGNIIVLSENGKIGIGLFLLAATWWVFEVIPIGVTAILIAVVQSIFAIRANNPADPPPPANIEFMNFMDPNVWFIFGSIVFGLVFTKTGLAKRMAYKMLILVGEKTSMIYLGSFVMTALLTLIMAHTAVAATLFPLFMAIYSLYNSSDKPTKFGKGLFIGMAFTAGAGSIITLLGAARGAVAIGFFKDIVGREITFFEVTKYMFPLGFIMVFVLWGYMMVVFKPEQKTIPGLRSRAESLYKRLGSITKNELLAVAIVLTSIIILSLKSFVPALGFLNKSAVILTTTVLFFLFNILSIKDLEEIPWNIILLFGGAMSIGFCLYETGAAEWMAIHWLSMFREAHWFIFAMGITFFILILTNLIMNVAAISISLPVALIIAENMGVAPEIILFLALAAAGMPFLFLVGAAPNAIAYNSGQFTTGEFFKVGIPASLILMVVLAIFTCLIWPLMGMPILLN
ncbi:SLC13 family permease [candidate division KSB1 bacterium]